MGRNNQQRRAAKARERAKRASAARHSGGTSAGSSYWGMPEAWSAAPWDSASFQAAAQPRLTMDQIVATEVNEAVDRLYAPDAYGADEAVGRVLNTAATAQGRRAVTRHIVRLLDDCVAALWQRGWAPSEIHRVVGRELDARAQAVVGDAMVHQLARYAEATVADRWTDQLAGVGATRWWPAETDPVNARAAVADEGLDPVLRSALRVIALMVGLPPMERLDPPAGHRASRVGARVLVGFGGRCAHSRARAGLAGQGRVNLL